VGVAAAKAGEAAGSSAAAAAAAGSNAAAGLVNLHVVMLPQGMYDTEPGDKAETNRVSCGFGGLAAASDVFTCAATASAGSNACCTHNSSSCKQVVGCWV
jgi:hypothetical protein